MQRTWGTLIFAAALVGGTVLVGSVGGGDLESWAITTLINLVFVVGLYVFVGNSGVLSFGHMSFAALGAYTAALLTIPVMNKSVVLTELPGWLADASTSSFVSILIGGALAALFAGVVGVALMRLSGIGAGIATLSLLIMVEVFLANTPALTGGAGSTLTGVPTTTGLPDAALWASVAIVVALIFQTSATGLRLRASRDEVVAARSIGIGVVRQRWVAFVLSAALTGVGGALYAHFVGAITVHALYFQYTFLVIAMLVVGGIGSLAGAVGGTVIVSTIAEILGRFEDGSPVGPLSLSLRPGVREVGLALALLLVLILRPGGLIGSRELPLPARWRRQPKNVPPAEEPA